MLIQTLFNNDDTVKIENSYKKYKQIARLFFLIVVPIEFLIAFLASRSVSWFFWPIIIVGLGFSIWAFNSVFLKVIKSLKQDLTEQLKLVGDLRVVSKSQRDKQWLIGFDSSELEEISLSQGTFEKIDIGDTLSIELAKNTKHIFKISKDGEVIFSKV